MADATKWQPFAVIARGPVRDADPGKYDVDADSDSEVFQIEVATNSDGETEKRETKLKGDERKLALLTAVYGAEAAAAKMEG